MTRAANLRVVSRPTPARLSGGDVAIGPARFSWAKLVVVAGIISFCAAFWSFTVGAMLQLV